MNLNREDFRLWLAAKDPNETVGQAVRASNCPVSAYLQDRYGGRWTVIPHPISTATTFDPKCVTHDLPLWAATFAGEVDRRFVLGDDLLPRSGVTAKTALTLLDDLEVLP